MARTAVIAGTASSVAGRVTARQQAAAPPPVPSPAAPPAVPPPTAPPPIAAAGVDQLHAQLLKLGELRTAGLLTDEEFAAQKSRLLQS